MADGREDTKGLPAASRARLTYTEAETLAIIAAEAEGKPHPFSDREKGYFAASTQPGRAETQAEDAGSLQLTFWADDKRALPTQFVASALFSVVQPKDAEY